VKYCSTSTTGGLLSKRQWPSRFQKMHATSWAAGGPRRTWLSDDVCDLLLSVSDSSNSSHLLSFLKLMICSCSLWRRRVSGDQTSGSGSSSGVVEAPPSCPFIHWARCRALPLLAPDLPSCRHLCSIRSFKCLSEVPRDLQSAMGVCNWDGKEAGLALGRQRVTDCRKQPLGPFHGTTTTTTTTTTTVQMAPWVTQHTDFSKAFCTVTMSQSFTVQENTRLHVGPLGQHGLPCADFHETRKDL
jgi:hypothetical protein